MHVTLVTAASSGTHTRAMGWQAARPCADTGAPDNGMWIPERGLGDTDGVSVTVNPRGLGGVNPAGGSDARRVEKNEKIGSIFLFNCRSFYPTLAHHKQINPIVNPRANPRGWVVKKRLRARAVMARQTPVV